MSSIRNALQSLIFFATLTSVWGADPFVGTWKLNPDKTKVIAGLAPKEGRFTVTLEGDHYVISEDDTFGDGTHVATHYMQPVNGGIIKYDQGGPPADVTEVVKKVNSTTREHTRTRGGRVIFTAEVVVRKDITMHVKGVNARGGVFDRVEIWERQ